MPVARSTIEPLVHLNTRHVTRIQTHGVSFHFCLYSDANRLPPAVQYPDIVSLHRRWQSRASIYVYDFNLS